jgi:hypothetical protein
MQTIVQSRNGSVFDRIVKMAMGEESTIYLKTYGTGRESALGD